jgi:CRISPR/Cas system-associated exonuclease Cas4 (RecB family)
LSDWEEKFKKYNSLFEVLARKKENSEGDLRFGRCTVRASDVAGQYYCEKKVELEYLFGEVETETKNQGTEGHENLLEDSETVGQEDLWKSVFGKKPVLAMEWLLLGEYKDVILAGQPDSVLFENGVPLVIFEYKFSRSRRAYPSHHAQAGFYGLLLKSLGFDTEQLYYAIVVADRRARDDPDLRDRVLEAVMKNGIEETVLSVENAIIYLNKFDEKIASSSLDWAIEFWKGKREAISTKNQNKCRVCEYFEQCQS